MTYIRLENNNMSEISSLDFEQFVEKQLNKVKIATQIEIKNREEFLKEHPLDAIKTMSPEDYCLGTQNYKHTLSYILEFGRIGFGIGGGSSKKHGIYFSGKDGKYHNGKNVIDDIDSYWPEFRNQLYTFIINSGSENGPVRLENFQLLNGMPLVLTKYLSLYYPDKYFSIGSYNVLKTLMETFGYPYEKWMKCYHLNYLLGKYIRRDYPLLVNEDGEVIGRLLWNYINGSSIADTKHNDKNNKEPGLGDQDVEERRYWLCSPGKNASKWDYYSTNGLIGIGWGELGDIDQYKDQASIIKKLQEISHSDNSFKMDSLATWQFAKEMKTGDIIYAKKGLHKIVGRGVITSDYKYDSDVEDNYKNIRSVKWTNIGEWDYPGQAMMKTLTDITSYTAKIEYLESLFADPDEEESEVERHWPKYSKEQFLEEVYIDEKAYESLTGLIKNKKNVILQGAPGVGKTYAANRLAYSIMGEKNKDRVQLIQFHQSYSYEDFIEGFRPSGNGLNFEIKKGSFYKFCKRAEEDPENDYFFIIDEINRGNISKIFGELFMLIEKDKRGNSLKLLYSDEKFSVPTNVYIIGMMNTADRSLALIDYALRRRFAFFDMRPAFENDNEGFKKYQESLNDERFDHLVDVLKDLNNAIRDDESLGKGFCIGHSYLCGISQVDDMVLANIVNYEIIPLLEEYWYDNYEEVENWKAKLENAIK